MTGENIDGPADEPEALEDLAAPGEPAAEPAGEATPAGDREQVEAPESAVEVEADPVSSDEPQPELDPSGVVELDDAELDPLSQALEAPAAAVQRTPRIRNIDFSRPTKFSQEHQRRIVRLHETFCRGIGTLLSAELRLPLEFQLISTSQMSWASATAELPASSLFGMMDVLPGSERALIACELPLLQYCLDRMLGGDGLTTPQRAELTEIELALSQRLMERLISQLSLVWSESVGTTFELRNVDTQISNVQLVTPSEAVLGLTVEVTLERGSSTFTVVFPHVAVEPILEQLSAGHFGERRPVDYDGAPLREALLPIDVELRVDVGSIGLSVAEALRLRPGQTIEFGPIESGVQLFGGDTATHVCRPGRIGEFRAVEIVSEGGDQTVTSDEALLLLGESIADAIADILRGLAPDGVERGPVSLAPKAELALQGLPPLGVVSSAAYVNGNGGTVVVMGRRAARQLGVLAAGADPSEAGEGPIVGEELSAIGEATARLIDTGAGITAALLGEDLELAPPTTRAYDSPAEVLAGLDLAPRATSVTYTFSGETIRFVHVIPNALLIRMTQVFDDRAAAQTLERLGDASESSSVRADTVREVTVTLRAELGRTQLSLIQASHLDAGAAVTLDRLVDDPVELFVNGRRFGTGELVSAGGRWAVRITAVTGVEG